MSRHRRKSRIIEEAQRRHANVVSIEPTLDFGHGMSVKVYAQKIAAAAARLADYNKLMADTEAARVDLEGAEKELGDLTTRFLASIAGRFGKDSPQYAQAGGRRTSERRRPGERKKELAARKRPHQRERTVAPPATPPAGGDSTSAASP